MATHSSAPHPSHRSRHPEEHQDHHRRKERRHRLATRQRSSPSPRDANGHDDLPERTSKKQKTDEMEMETTDDVQRRLLEQLGQLADANVKLQDMLNNADEERAQIQAELERAKQRISELEDGKQPARRRQTRAKAKSQPQPQSAPPQLEPAPQPQPPLPLTLHEAEAQASSLFASGAWVGDALAVRALLRYFPGYSPLSILDLACRFAASEPCTVGCTGETLHSETGEAQARFFIQYTSEAYDAVCPHELNPNETCPTLEDVVQRCRHMRVLGPLPMAYPDIEQEVVGRMPHLLGFLAAALPDSRFAILPIVYDADTTNCAPVEFTEGGRTVITHALLHDYVQRWAGVPVSEAECWTRCHVIVPTGTENNYIMKCHTLAHLRRVARHFPHTFSNAQLEQLRQYPTTVYHEESIETVP